MGEQVKQPHPRQGMLMTVASSIGRSNRPLGSLEKGAVQNPLYKLICSEDESEARPLKRATECLPCPRERTR